MDGKAIVMFDGVCNLCNGAVQFIIKRDSAGRFRFAALQSHVGQALLERYELSKEMDSFVLIEGDNVYMKSSAVLRICRRLKGGWPLLTVFLVVPRPIRDAVYHFVARNRYRWFGKQEACMLPTPELKERFLED